MDPDLERRGRRRPGDRVRRAARRLATTRSSSGRADRARARPRRGRRGARPLPRRGARRHLLRAALRLHHRLRPARPHRPARRLRHDRRGHRPGPHGDRLRRGRLPARRAVRDHAPEPGRPRRHASTSGSPTSPAASSRRPTPTSSRRSRRRASCCASESLPARLSALLALRHAAALLREVELVRHDHRGHATGCSPRTRRSAGTPSTSSTAASASGWRTTSTGRSRATATGARRCRSGSATPTDCDERFCAGSVAEPARAAAPRSPTTCTAPTSTRSASPASARAATARCAASPAVIDTWFDSGSMPFAQFHYPFENEELFEERFPADFICEAIDQTRGWFYTLLAESVLLFDQSSYRNCVCLGLILDPEGQKMSKSRGNVVEPWDVIDQPRRRRLPLVLLHLPAALGGLPLLGRHGRRVGAPVPADALEHVLVLGALRERRGARAGASGRLRRPDARREGGGPSSTAGRSRASRRTIAEVREQHRRLRLHHRRPRDRRLRRRALQLVRAAQPPPLLGRRRSRVRHAAPLPGRGSRSCSRRSPPSSPTRSTRNLVGGRRASEFGDAPGLGPPLRLPRAPTRRSIDPQLEAGMEAVRRTVELGRAARAQAKVKIRQPLRKAVVVASDAERDGDRAPRRHRRRRAQRQGARVRRRARPSSSRYRVQAQLPLRSARASASRCRRSPPRSRRSTPTHGRDGARGGRARSASRSTATTTR